MSEQFEKLKVWVTRHRMSFGLVEDPKSTTAPCTLIEKPSGKNLSFSPGELVGLEEDRDSVRGGSYLRVTLADGRHFALAGIGFAFAPSFASTGPLPDCPPVGSFADFGKLHRHLTHLVSEHHEEQPREALQTLMVCLAFLDGAREIGLEVGPEERMIERQLQALEERGIAP